MLKSDIIVVVVLLSTAFFVFSGLIESDKTDAIKRQERCEQHAQVLRGADTGLHRLLVKEREQGQLSRDDLDAGLAYRSVLRSGNWSTACYKPINK